VIYGKFFVLFSEAYCVDDQLGILFPSFPSLFVTLFSFNFMVISMINQVCSY
jgi:hypothetical protein